MKDESWDGEFLDVPEGMTISDRSVFKLQLQEEEVFL